jgi:hypothetical protein
MTIPECFGCGTSVPGGMLILGQYLCPSCEAALLRAEVGKMEYQDWIDNCKRFWEKTGIQGKEFEDEA